MAGGVIRVLVVDDSAFVRKVIAQLLRKSPFIEVVGTARDGSEALELTERLKPDVITLDLVMAPMDGVAFLRQQMPKHPVPVVICSVAHETGEMALDAFDAGAVEFVQKPTALATDKLLEIGDELVAKVKTAASVRMSALRPETPPPSPVQTGTAQHAGTATEAARTSILVIGVSTGGPQALRRLIPQLPADFAVPVAIVLHMPVGYTELFAQRLNEISTLRVVEAGEGNVVEPGTVLLAPAGRHLTFVRGADGVVCTHLDVRPIDTQHRPAVDVLFRSAAKVYGDGVVAVVMTGMGSDGLAGAQQIKASGGRVITEAESSCVVYGMPRAIDEAGLTDVSAPLERLPSVILDML